MFVEIMSALLLSLLYLYSQVMATFIVFNGHIDSSQCWSLVKNIWMFDYNQDQLDLLIQSPHDFVYRHSQ